MTPQHADVLYVDVFNRDDLLEQYCEDHDDVSAVAASLSASEARLVLAERRLLYGARRLRGRVGR